MAFISYGKDYLNIFNGIGYEYEVIEEYFLVE